MNTFRKTPVQRFTEGLLMAICWLVSIIAGVCFIVLAIAAVVITIVLGVLFGIVYFLLPINDMGTVRKIF